jgi:hypothetical protein
MNDYYKSIDWPCRIQSVNWNFLQMADSDIIVSLHLVIRFISMLTDRATK